MKTPENNFKIPYTDLRSQIKRFIQQTWQKRWATNTDNKLFIIKPFLGECDQESRERRKFFYSVLQTQTYDILTLRQPVDTDRQHVRQ